MKQTTKNVIFLLIDALRFDAISCNDQKQFLKKYHLEDVPDTPNIDNLARDGVYFPNMISCAPDTPASHGSIFTGLYPSAHGLRSFFERKIPKHIKTIFEIFKENDYTTLSIADPYLFNFLDLSRGADYNLSLEGTVNAIDVDWDNQKMQNVFPFLQENMGRRNFIFCRLTGVHYPYFVPDSAPDKELLSQSLRESESLAERFGLNFILSKNSTLSEHIKQWNSIRSFIQNKIDVAEVLFPYYLRGVNWFDKYYFKWFIDNLNSLFRDTMIILTADHGEAKISPTKVENRNIRFDHCVAGIDQLLKVPFILTAKELPKGKVIKNLVSSVDILPTISDILSFSLPKNYEIQGSSLLPLIKDDKSSSETTLYSEHSWWNDGKKFKDATEFQEQCYREQKLLNYTPVLRQQSIRTEKYRYVQLGEENFEEDFKLDNKEFVENLYIKILAYWGPEEEIQKYTKMLETSQITKKDLYNQFLSKAIADGKYSLYDIEEDPYEEVNLLQLENPEYERIAEELKREMKRVQNCRLYIEKSSEDVEQKMTDSEVKEITKRLKELGYL